MTSKSWKHSEDFKAFERISKTMQEEIDFGVLCDLSVRSGWTKVTLSLEYQNKEIRQWVYENVKGGYNHYNNIWLFELPSDATWFRMMWL